MPPRRRAAVSLIAALLAGGVLIAGCGDDDGGEGDDGGDGGESSAGIEGLETFAAADLSREHTEKDVDYDQTPPVGGAHSEVWRNCGFYAEPVPDEQGVHSMEHGAVWITFQPGLAAAQVEIVRGLAEGRTFVLASPHPDLPRPVVASAWGLQLELDSADDPRLEEFVDAYREGPQTPERGAPCTGGSDG